MTVFGMAGLTLDIPCYGVAFIALLGGAMGLLNFFVSAYLNAMIDLSERATILSFRGLAFAPDPRPVNELPCRTR